MMAQQYCLVIADPCLKVTRGTLHLTPNQVSVSLRENIRKTEAGILQKRQSYEMPSQRRMGRQKMASKVAPLSFAAFDPTAQVEERI